MAAGASDDRQELLNLIKDGWFEERQSFWTGTVIFFSSLSFFPSTPRLDARPIVSMHT